MRPAISDASWPIEASGSRSGPFAIAVPSRASIAARAGRSVSRLSFSPRRRPGKTSSERQSTPFPPCSRSPVGTTSVPVRRPKMRVSIVTGTRIASPSSRTGPVDSFVRVSTAAACL
jgi:hypothetical protein